jgi:hypothetical protein
VHAYVYMHPYMCVQSSTDQDAPGSELWPCTLSVLTDSKSEGDADDEDAAWTGFAECDTLTILAVAHANSALCLLRMGTSAQVCGVQLPVFFLLIAMSSFCNVDIMGVFLSLFHHTSRRKFLKIPAFTGSLSS